jgi:hypothetical protein
MRMHMRRFTRLTKAFSKTIENRAHSVALHFMFYDFDQGYNHGFVGRCSAQVWVSDGDVGWECRR